MRSVQPQGGRLDRASGRHPHEPRRAGGDDGAVLVEFAIIAPLLFAFIFAVIEFGWAFYQHLDVRHGAREGARLAAVDFGNGAADIRDEVCSRMDADTTVRVLFAREPAATVGDEGTVTVEKPLQTLTGFYDWVLDDIDLRSSVDMRLEQDPTWNAFATPSDGACGP